MSDNSSMRKYHRTTKTEDEFFAGKKSLKRNVWFCRKTKGSHEFVLMFPPYWDYWASNNFDHLSNEFKSLYKGVKTPEDFYKADDNRGKERIFPKSRWWECVHCGKRTFDSEIEPDKRIREHLFKENAQDSK